MTMPLRFLLMALVLFAASAFASETPAPPWSLWDGHESIEQYAKRVNLPPTKTLDRPRRREGTARASCCQALSAAPC